MPQELRTTAQDDMSEVCFFKHRLEREKNLQTSEILGKPILCETDTE